MDNLTYSDTQSPEKDNQTSDTLYPPYYHLHNITSVTIATEQNSNPEYESMLRSDDTHHCPVTKQHHKTPDKSLLAKELNPQTDKRWYPGYSVCHFYRRGNHQ
ncbi:MAG: hypothetical protein IIY14_01945, partial [Bacteroidales bacterium]|nr:hypothetical protein [Bacteroidales bacterium]